MLGFPALPGPLRSPASSPRRITPMDWKSPRFAKFQGSVPKNSNFNRHRVTTEAVSSSSMHRGRLQDAPFYPVLGRTWLGIQKTAMGSQGSQVKFGRSQSGKVISESPESPNVHSSTGQKYIYTSKRHSKRNHRCWMVLGCKLATHRATPPGNPGLRSFRNIFRCQNVDIEIPSSENPPSLPIFKSHPSHSLDFFASI